MRPNRAIAALSRRLNELKPAVASADPDFLRKTALQVSEWSVGQHYDHLTKVHLNVLQAILRGLPEEKDKRANLLGHILMFAGWLPRGYAKSPDRVRGIDPSPDELRKRVGEAAELFKQLESQPELLSDRSRRMRHPRFGWLDAAEWVKAVADHQWHHQKIVRDILKAQAS